MLAYLSGSAYRGFTLLGVTGPVEQLPAAPVKSNLQQVATLAPQLSLKSYVVVRKMVVKTSFSPVLSENQICQTSGMHLKST